MTFGSVTVTAAAKSTSIIAMFIFPAADNQFIHWSLIYICLSCNLL